MEIVRTGAIPASPEHYDVSLFLSASFLKSHFLKLFCNKKGHKRFQKPFYDYINSYCVSRPIESQ